MTEEFDGNIFKEVRFERNFSFAKNTTYRCGGNAELAFYPRNIGQAERVYDYILAHKIRYVTMGCGSNVLAADGHFKGVVISTKSLCGISITGEDKIFCYAGTTASALMNFCREQGLTGLEYLAGIPATVGGLVFMNGGAGGVFISANVEQVLFYDGKLRHISNKSCNFGYKYSTMRDIKGIILGVELKVSRSVSACVDDNISFYLKKRLLQPKGASCGCVFKNYNGMSAGLLIEKAGLKGMSFGGASVSNIHANFIINNCGTAADVHELIAKVKSAVYDKTGIMLEEEVVYIGDF